MTNLIAKINKPILGIVLIVLETIILGTIPVATKEVISSVSPATLFAIRLTIAAILLTPFVRKLNFTLVRDGVILGLPLFITFATSTIGLETASANQASFIFGLNMVFVILFQMLLHRRLFLNSILAAILALTGMGFMFWESDKPLIGDLWLLASALSDAAHIILTDRLSSQHSPIALTAIQLWVVAAIGIFWAAPELTGQIQVIQTNLYVLIYLGVVATTMVVLLQTLAQRWINAHEVALLFALEPIFGAAFAFLLLGETFSTHSFIGAAMVLIGIIFTLSQNGIDEDDAKPSLLEESKDMDGAAKMDEMLVGKVVTDMKIKNFSSIPSPKTEAV